MKKTVIVTGGTRGIGAAISLKMARSGHKVFALYARNRKAAELLNQVADEEGLDIITLKGDLTHQEKFNNVISSIKSKCSKVDILIHCAASGVHREALDLTIKHFRWTFEINVFSFHELMKELVPMMSDGARIIALTSAGGTKVIPFYTAVGSSKGALESLIRHYASELAPKGITANLLCPGMVETDAIKAFPDTDARLKKAIEKTPTKKLTTPEQVADWAFFLADHPAASQLVGQTIVIDGGQTLA